MIHTSESGTWGRASGGVAPERLCARIYELRESGVEVRHRVLADLLGVTRTSIIQMVQKLQEMGALAEGSPVVLTEKGQRIAELLVRRHRIAECLLIDVFGVGWADAGGEALEWEVMISGRTEAALYAYLGSPTTCPHGNPIPGSASVDARDTPISALGEGSQFTVARIPPELEYMPEMLRFLADHHVGPGVRGQVVTVAPDGIRTALFGSTTLGLGPAIGDRLLVVPTEEHAALHS